MKRWTINGTVMMVLALALLAGCKKEPATPEPVEPVKTAEEFKAEADQQIDAENLDAELNKMEEEIEADVSAEQ